jgi:hypothetical protein
MKLFGVINDPTRFYFGRPGRPSRAHRIELHFCWYDLWVGAYWSPKARALYICPLPMLAIKITFELPPC